MVGHNPDFPRHHSTATFEPPHRQIAATSQLACHAIVVPPAGAPGGDLVVGSCEQTRLFRACNKILRELSHLFKTVECLERLANGLSTSQGVRESFHFEQLLNCH